MKTSSAPDVATLYPPQKTTVELSPEEILKAVQDNDWKDNREHWKSKLYYIFVLLLCSASFHNIYGCPLASLKYGGVSFILPYTICTIFLGIPLHFLELSLGQYSQRGFIKIWDSVPISRGIGWSCFCVCVLSTFCFTTYAAYSFIYLSRCFDDPLFWQDCDRPLYKNHSCSPKFYQNSNNANRYSPSEHFFNDHVLQIVSIGHRYAVGKLVWHVVVAYIYCWFTVCICLYRYLVGFEKVAIIAVGVTITCLVTLCSVAVQAKGSVKGIKMLLEFRQEYLLHFETWTRAAEQVLFELAIGQGTLFVMGSHTHHRNKTNIDSRRIVMVNYVMSLVSIIITWSFLGASSVFEEYVAVQDPGFIFVLYADVLGNLPYGNLWCAICFTLFFVSCISNQLILTFTLLAAFKDEIKLRDLLKVISILTCLIFAIIGIVLCSTTGFILLNAIWDIPIRLSKIPLAFLTISSFVFIYGINKYCEDVHFLINFYPSFFYRLCFYLAPLALFCLYYSNCYYFISFKSFTYPNDLVLFLILLTFMLLLTFLVFLIYRMSYCALKKQFKNCWRSLNTWGPNSYKGRIARTFFSSENRRTLTHPWRGQETPEFTANL